MGSSTNIDTIRVNLRSIQRQVDAATAALNLAQDGAAGVALAVTAITAANVSIIASTSVVTTQLAAL